MSDNLKSSIFSESQMFFLSGKLGQMISIVNTKLLLEKKARNCSEIESVAIFSKQKKTYENAQAKLKFSVSCFFF